MAVYSHVIVKFFSLTDDVIGASSALYNIS